MRAEHWREAFRTAQTAEASTVHEPVGKPDGPGLWHHKGLQLPPYVQHVANELRKQGHGESDAVEMAVGIVKNWAAGHDGHGHKVHPDVQAAAAKNVAQWEALKGGTRGARRFNPNHAPAGQPGGGEFASSGGSGSGAKAAAKPHAGHPAKAAQPAPTAGAAHRKAALLAQAHADRQAAHRLQAELHVVEAQLQQAHAAATKAATAAKAASAKKATKATVHKATAVTHHKTAATTTTTSTSVTALQAKAASLRTRISGLLGQARALDKRAAAIRSVTPAWNQVWQQVWHQGSEAPGSG